MGQLLTGLFLRGPGETERGGHDSYGRGAVPAHPLCDSQGMAGKLEDAVGTGGAIPTNPVRDDYPAGDPRAATETGDGAESGTTNDQERSPESHGGNEATGWEFEREIFLRTVQTALRQSQGIAGGIWQTGQESQGIPVDHTTGLGGTLGIGLRGVSALSRLTDTDSDDPEEQKRRQEAAQAATNAGAILGLTMGAISAMTQENQSLTGTPDESQIIEEEEDFNEFLARMDEKYGYQEEQQMM